MELNADFGARVVVHSEELDWVASPVAGVDRRMLERQGDEHTAEVHHLDDPEAEGQRTPLDAAAVKNLQRFWDGLRKGLAPALNDLLPQQLLRPDDISFIDLMTRKLEPVLLTRQDIGKLSLAWVRDLLGLENSQKPGKYRKR